MKYLISFIFFISFLNVQSQTVKTDTLTKIPFDINRIKNPTRLSLNSNVFSYDSLYIWNDKRTLSEIMDQRPGFFVNDFGLGGRNNINFNGNSFYQTGIFRDGIQINDIYYQGAEIQNFSISEIDKVEEISAISSFFYGINSSSKSVNVITKDIFNPQPFSQFRYSQDRDGSLYADVFLTMPFSRKGNVLLGITKHSLDGMYTNSAFDVWRGRARVNLFLSPKLNARLDFSMSNFDRGLNEGLIYSSNKDSLQDPMEAMVVDPNTTENLQNYFYSALVTGKFFKNDNWFTKLKLYSYNSLRFLFNPADTNITGLYPGYQHSIIYGGELLQNITLNSGKYFTSNITFGGNIYFNLLSGNISPENLSGTSLFQNLNETYYSLKAKYDLSYKIFSASILFRNDNILSNNYINSGAEASVKAIDQKDIDLKFSGGYRRTDYNIYNAGELFSENIPFSNSISGKPVNFFNAGTSFRYKTAELEFEYSKGDDTLVTGGIQNINAGLNIISQYFDFTLNYNNSNNPLFPENYFKSDIAYKNILFRGKLKLKTGFNFKYYNIRNIVTQDQVLYSYNKTANTFPQPNQYMVDFYVGARVGRANINLTVANILNTLVYNAYLFPLDDRGGFLNAISRFTIVWDFIN